MAKKESKLQLAQELTEEAIRKTNEKIDELGNNTGNLYGKLNDIQEQFDAIRNIPNERRIQYEQLKAIRSNWKLQAEKIEQEYKDIAFKNAGGAAAGVGAGVAVAALGPAAAMGIATTFGVASTGTAISALSGVAATNAALAWLGGGALVAGGGGMAAGNAFLALAGPAGWAIAGIALLGSGFMLYKATSEKRRLENVFTLICERDTTSYELAIVELNERIVRIKNESSLIDLAINKIKSFGTDYNAMSEIQQYELGAYVNLMEASTQLLINPIMGLLPKYSEEDYAKFCARHSTGEELAYYTRNKKILITLCNLFYKIEMDVEDRRLIVKALKNNKDFMTAMEIDENKFNADVMISVALCLNYKYTLGIYI